MEVGLDGELVDDQVLRVEGRQPEVRAPPTHVRVGDAWAGADSWDLSHGGGACSCVMQGLAFSPDLRHMLVASEGSTITLYSSDACAAFAEFD